ncbi:MAG: hypothetical protein RBR73_04870, partial [Halothiobacillaceae bacterium]|nr:hypothetical protein [Halothiobacillaceae bacterium]
MLNRLLPSSTSLDKLLDRRGLLFWIAGLFTLLWLAHLPLTRDAQTVMAATLVITLFVIMLSMDRLEIAQARQIKYLRLLAILLAAFVSLRYFSWRINYTISYHDPLSLIGAFLLLGAEIYGLGIYLIGAYVNSWPINRNPPPLPEDADQLPTVDILIPSYNEDPELLELTLLAATQIDYPRHRFKVYLCDDGGTVQRRNTPALSTAAWKRHHTRS